MKSKETSKILFVDDSAAIRKLVSFTLKFRKYDVELAEDGVDALEKLKSFSPDLIITDILMPRMDGFELIQKIKTDQKLKNTPLVVLTTEGQEENVEKGKKMGVTHYIKKPFQPQILLQVIENALGDRGAAERQVA